MKTRKIKKSKMPPMKNVSPFTLIGALQDPSQHVIVVNVLAPDKVPIKLTCARAENIANLTKNEFEHLLETNNNKIEADLVILYCGSWSCNAASNYYKSLYQRKINVKKIMDYKGSIHEWATYSLLFPELFQVLTLPDYKIASRDFLQKLTKDTMHSYMVKDEQKDRKVVDYVNMGIKNKVEFK